MADADSILASLEDAVRAVLAIQSVCDAAQGDVPAIGDLRASLAFGVAVMAEHALERVEAVKTLVKGARA
ncbi:hypothetical protein D3C72_2060150 [compost metagenome]